MANRKLRPLEGLTAKAFDGVPVRAVLDVGSVNYPISNFSRDSQGRFDYELSESGCDRPDTETVVIGGTAVFIDTAYRLWPEPALSYFDEDGKLVREGQAMQPLTDVHLDRVVGEAIRQATLNARWHAAMTEASGDQAAMPLVPVLDVNSLSQERITELVQAFAPEVGPGKMHEPDGQRRIAALIAEQQAVADVLSRRGISRGSLYSMVNELLERLDQAHAPVPAQVKAEAVDEDEPDDQGPRYVAATGWPHIFAGNRADTVRWVFDIEQMQFEVADIEGSGGWSPISDRVLLADLLEDLTDNGVLDPGKEREDLEVSAFDTLEAATAWVQEEDAHRAPERPRAA